MYYASLYVLITVANYRYFYKNVTIYETSRALLLFVFLYQTI